MNVEPIAAGGTHAWLRDALYHAPIGVGLLDAELRFRWVNRAMSRIDGLAEERHVGMWFGDVVTDARLRQQIVDDLVGTMQDRQSRENVKMCVYDPAGRVQRYYVASYHPVEHGPAGVFFFLEDRTEDQQLEQQRDDALARECSAHLEVERREQRLMSVLEAAEVGVWEHDIATGLTSVDAQSRRLLEVDVGQLDLLSQIEASDRFEVARTLLEIGAGSLASATLEFRVVTRGGTRWVRGSARRWQDKLGGPRIIGTLQDVTARRSWEEELARRAETNRMMVGVVSHDLRNPIAAILMSVQALGSRVSDEPTKRVLQRIEASAERARRLTYDLLDSSQAWLGGVPLQRVDVDLAQVVAAAVDELARAHPDRTIRTRLPETCSGVWDPERLAQVVSNLTANALQHSPVTSVVDVVVRAEEREAVIEVHNEGEPIGPELVARMFKPWQRGGARGANGKSTGLGLYIVAQIVDGHGGTVDVVSAQEQGTSFFVRLPRG